MSSESQRPPTIKDVAARAHASTGTTSKALRGIGNVEPSIAEAVRRAASELGYRPNLGARTLRSGRLGIIAVAIPQLPEGSELRNAPGFWERAIHSLLHELLRADVCTIVIPHINSEQMAKLPCDAIVIVTNQAADIAAPIGHHPNTPLLVMGLDATDQEALVVPVDGWYHGSAGAVVRAALDHLIENGARQPGIVAAEQPMLPLAMIAQEASTWGQEVGIEPLVTSANDVYASTSALLDQGCDAIVVYGDDAQPDLDGVIGAVADAGRRIPDDVLVLSISNGGRAPATTPPITTIGRSGDELGILAASWILDGLATGDFPSATFPYHLVQRESTTRST